MGTLIIISIMATIAALLIKAIIKKRKTSDSTLSVFEHPSTFKKPNIEMTAGNALDKDDDEKKLPPTIVPIEAKPTR